MNIAPRTRTVVSAAALALLVSACTATNEVATSTTSGSSDVNVDPITELVGELNGAGASSQQVAMEAWRAEFQNQNPGLTINYDPVGSGGGRTQFIDGATAWAGSDAALDEEEYAQAADRCGADGAINLPIYVSAIAIAFNLEGIDSLNLDAATVAKIFAGEITAWNDPAIADQNPGVDLPATAITIVSRSDNSGTTTNFTDYLAKASDGAWPYEASGDWPNSLGESGQGTSGVMQILNSTPGTIGYADESQVAGLGVVAVKVGESYNGPSAEGAAIALESSIPAGVNGDNDLAYELDRSTTAAGAYPVMMVSYVIVCQQYDDAQVAANVTGFLTYVASQEGQAVAASAAGSAPISPALSDSITEILDGIAAASGAK